MLAAPFPVPSVASASSWTASSSALSRGGSSPAPPIGVSGETVTLLGSSVGAGALAARAALQRRKYLKGSRQRSSCLVGKGTTVQKVTGSVVLSALKDEFVACVSKTGSPAHTVLQAKIRLDAAGFKELKDNEPWEMKPGGLYYITPQGTNICAFAVGGAFDEKKGGFVMTSAHVDTPCLKLRPISKLPEKAKTLQLGVDTYGGGLWHTWFDRPLGMAGKIVVATSAGDETTPRKFEEKLVHIQEPICVIPNLAIHLTTADERKAFGFNNEVQLRPVLCAPPMGRGGTKMDSMDEVTATKRHPDELLAKIADVAGINPDDIVDVDLCLMDAAPAITMGPYVSAPRIDNGLSTWATVDALAAFAEGTSLAASTDIMVVASFDHEEVGSVSATGADSVAMERWLQRCLEALGVASAWPHFIARSFMLSCDGAHGLNPNYADKHQSEHAPLLGGGIVIKTNPNQRYATTPVLAQRVREIGRLSNTSVQEFVVRNDCPCGSTVGPMLSAQLSVRTVDIGAPQWAMHSIRETAHGDDVEALRNICLGLFEHFRSVDAAFETL